MTDHYDELEEEVPEPPSPYRVPEVEEILNRVADIVENARPMPLSSMSMVNKEEILDLLDEAIERLPEELRAARWLLKEREEFLERARRDGEEILERARSRAERMVQRTEVVKAAEQRARQIIDAAEREARRMRHEVEDYCDQKLASFEVILERTLRLVQAGREKLQASTPEQYAPDQYAAEDEAAEPTSADGFFDEHG
ncbi:MAG: hypothetical protein KatS3mg008_0721 [Acidimicrobiales bacterium]|nr:MAG: hypothetical protein KatS3mg008_0721 [Acidimicrobiales bacterium]